MRQGGRLAAAIEVLEAIETRHRPVAEALKDWGVAHRFAGSGDRAAIGNIVYDALRWRLSGAWVMGGDTPRARVLATIGWRWGVGADALAAMFADDQHAPEPLSEEEAGHIAHPDLSAAPGHIRADLPEWLASRFEQVFGGDWVAEGAALAERPPLDMRVNRLKADRDKVIKALGKFGAVEASFAPDAIRIPATAGQGRHPNIQNEPGFQKGWFEVQDLGSQIAAQMVAAQPGEQVLDLCAGGGGKTLALASIMANKGQVFATDSDRARLAPIFDRLKRAGARNVQVREAGASLDDLAGRMDAVLIDAPCTGSGVWRRRPDAKWRLTERALEERIGEQAALLGSAAQYVRAGGRLVYVTCSLLPEEDADQVAAFLAGHPEFTAAPATDLTAGMPGLGDAALDAGNGVILYAAAHRHGRLLHLRDEAGVTADAVRRIARFGDLAVLPVLATEQEYGPHLKRLITPLITGVGPVEAAAATAAALASLDHAGRRLDLVLSLGSAGSRTLEHAGIYQIASVAYRDMDASLLGFPKGVTPFLDEEAVIPIPYRIPDIPAASISTGAAIISGGGYAPIDADMVDMESFAVLRACRRFGVPMIGLRGISDGRNEVTGLHDWTEYLHVIDEKLAAALEAFGAHVRAGRFTLAASP